MDGVEIQVKDAEVAINSVEGRLRFWWRLLVRLALLAVAGYVVWRTKGIISTVIAALVLACAAEPLVEIFCRRRFGKMRPHGQRALATALAYIIIFTVTGVIISQLLSPFQREIGKLLRNLPAYQDQINTQVLQVQNWYANLPQQLRDMLEHSRNGGGAAGAGGEFSLQTWATETLKHTLTFASHAVELFLVPVLAFYFTLDGKTIRNQLLSLVPRKHQRASLAILSEGGAIMRSYLVSQFFLAVLAGVITFIIVKLIGMDYAIILALFAGLTRAIPVIGPFLGGVPVSLLAFIHGAQHGHPYLWVFVTLGFAIMHVFESKVLMPMFLGHALNLHAAFILLALLVGGEFFGLMGMFLAAPVAALVRLLLVHYVILPRRHGRHFHVPAHGGAHGQGHDHPAPPKNGNGPRVLSLARAVRHTTVYSGTNGVTAESVLTVDHVNVEHNRGAELNGLVPVSLPASPAAAPSPSNGIHEVNGAGPISANGVTDKGTDSGGHSESNGTAPVLERPAAPAPSTEPSEYSME